MTEARQPRWRYKIANATYLAEVERAFKSVGLELRHRHQAATDRYVYRLGAHQLWLRHTTWTFQVPGRAAILIARMLEEIPSSYSQFYSEWTFDYYVQVATGITPDCQAPRAQGLSYDPLIFSPSYWRNRQTDATGFDIHIAAVDEDQLSLNLRAVEQPRTGLKQPTNAAVAAKAIVDLLQPFTRATFTELSIGGWSPGANYVDAEAVKADFWDGFPAAWLRDMVPPGKIIGHELLPN